MPKTYIIPWKLTADEYNLAVKELCETLRLGGDEDSILSLSLACCAPEQILAHIGTLKSAGAFSTHLWRELCDLGWVEADPDDEIWGPEGMNVWVCSEDY